MCSEGQRDAGTRNGCSNVFLPGVEQDPLEQPAKKANISTSGDKLDMFKDLPKIE